MKFELVMLDELYDISSGLSKGKAYFGRGYPFLSFKTVFNSYFLPDELSELADTTDRERCSYSIKAGDVFLTRTSENTDELGMSCVALRDYPDATFNGFTKRLRPKMGVVIHPIFAGYWFRTSHFRELVKSMSVMTTRASLNNEMIQKLKMPMPPIEAQSKIAAALFCLDAKIAINRAINNHLEQMAQAIFKSWFVDFEPFGGKQPANWTAGNLLEIADYLNGLAMQRFRPADGEVGLPVLKIKELRQGVCDSSSELCSPNIRSDYIVHDGDVIFSWSGSLLVNFWCGGDCGLNQHLFKVTSTRYDKWFYYVWTCHHLTQFVAMAADKATTMGHIKRDALANAEVLIPDEEGYQELGFLLAPLYEQAIACRVENRRLALLRDSLLPRLMSGELSVADANAK